MNLRRLEDADLNQWFVIFSLLLRELKKYETFASLLNIHGGDIRVVPAHLVWTKYLEMKCVKLSPSSLNIKVFEY